MFIYKFQRSRGYLQQVAHTSTHMCLTLTSVRKIYVQSRSTKWTLILHSYSQTKQNQKYSQQTKGGIFIRQQFNFVISLLQEMID